MKEYKASTGGRYTYAEDLLNLQELALSSTSLFTGINNCVLSGCSVTRLPSGNVNIGSGVVWLDGKIRAFVGANDINIASGYYIKVSNIIESVKYANDASKVGRENFGTVGQQTLPTGSQYIFINSEGLFPTIEVELFGKYCLIKNPRSNSQTVSGSVDISGGFKANEMSATMLNLSDAIRGYMRVLRSMYDDSGITTSYIINGGVKSQIKHGDDGKIYFIINGINVATFSKDKCEFIATSSGSQISDKIQISGDNINLTGDASSSGSIKVNFKGYQGGNTVDRSVDIYNGRGSKLFSFNGAGTNESFVDLVIGKAANLTLKHSELSLAETGFSKFYEIKDRTDSSLMKFGFWNGQTLKLDSNGNVFDMTVPLLNVSGVVFESGKALSEKYASVLSLSELDKTVVKKDGTKVLCDVNFTQAFSDKLSAIKTSTISSGADGYVVASDVKTEIGKTLSKASNLMDLTDLALARTNLSVNSKEEADNKFLAKTNNLLDLSDKKVARMNLDTYSKEEVDTKVSSSVTAHSYSKADSDGKYQSKLKVVDWMSCSQGAGVGMFNIKAKQVGNVVSIQGSLVTAPTGSTWITIPNEIDAPVNAIGGVAKIEIRDVSANYGLQWKCNNGSRAITVVQQHGGHTNVDILITYLV